MPFFRAQVYSITHPTHKETLVSTGYNVIGRNETKAKDWYYTSTYKPFVSKHFIAASTEYKKYGESALKKIALGVTSQSQEIQ